MKNKNKISKISNVLSKKVASIATIFIISFTLLFSANDYAEGKNFD